MKKTALIAAIGLSISMTASAGEMPFSGPDSVDYSKDL